MTTDKERRAEKIRRDRLEKDARKDQKKWSSDWKEFLSEKYGISDPKGETE